ncbi:MAG TPA: hypothetical protein VK651_07240 [Blastocatellia bacterium]|nr:hypothetical protein [Blastocatellia bacterium]
MRKTPLAANRANVRSGLTLPPFHEFDKLLLDLNVAVGIVNTLFLIRELTRVESLT